MSEQSPYAIESDKLTKRFEHVTAVDGVDLAVGYGEIFGLIGPDGAGKTTLIRLLATVIPPTAGTARVLGYDITRDQESIRADVGYMPQRFSLYGDLSVWENLNFFADVHGVRGKEREERLKRLLAFARLERFRDRRARYLSGGMQKKLALACALVHHPRLLLLDEPTTGVDPVSRREFWDILAELLAQGVTILVSTPYMDEAERCTRVGLMYQGNILVQDTPEAIIARVPGHLLEIHILPGEDGRLPMRRARDIVAQVEGVSHVQAHGDQLRAFVDQPDAILPRLRRALDQGGIPYNAIQPGRPHLEDAFIHMMSNNKKVISGR